MTALLLGIPAGYALHVLAVGLAHPAVGYMLWHHPLLTVPALLGGGLAGIELTRDGLSTRGWVVAAACGVYLVIDWARCRADRRRQPR